MAIVTEIKKASFVDESATADINTVQYRVYDDAASPLVNGYVDYDFVDARVVHVNVEVLTHLGAVKTEVEAMIASRGKDTITLPTLVKSMTEKDGAGAVTKYTERY